MWNITFSFQWQSKVSKCPLSASFHLSLMLPVPFYLSLIIIIFFACTPFCPFLSRSPASQKCTKSLWFQYMIIYHMHHLQLQDYFPPLDQSFLVCFINPYQKCASEMGSSWMQALLKGHIVNKLTWDALGGVLNFNWETSFVWQLLVLCIYSSCLFAAACAYFGINDNGTRISCLNV